MIRGGHGGRRARQHLDDSVQLHPEDNMFDTPITSRVPYNDLRNTLGRHDSYGHGGRAHHGRYYGRRASRATNYPYNRHEGGSVRRIVSPKHKTVQGNTVKYDLKSCIEANQLDDLSPGDIEKLQRLLDRKKSREQQRQHQQQNMSMYSGMMDHGRRPPILPYVGRVPDVKRLLTENRFARLVDLVVPLDVLSGTDFVKHVHAQFENVSREEMDELVLARTVAINSAPSLLSILLMVEETCSYFAGLDRLNIPVNPYDPYSSTLSALKHATFSKLNVAKLSCMMSEGERTPASSAYDFLKKIASGNGTTVKSFSRSVDSTVAPFPAATKPVVPEISDIREFDFEIFKHPFQVVICYLATIEKIVSEIKGHRAPGTVGSHINNKDRSRYIKDYDTQGILKRFQDGCIINLVKQGFCEHVCNDNACKRRGRYALSVPHNLGMIFCPPTESSAVDDMDMYFERNRQQPMRSVSFDDSRSATSSVDSSCSTGSHKPLTPTEGGGMPDFHDANNASSNCGGGGPSKFSDRRVSYKQHRRRSTKHISPLDRPSDNSHYHQRHRQNGDRRSSRGAGSSSSVDNGATGPRLSPSAKYPSDSKNGGNGRRHSHQNGDDCVPHSPVTTPPPPEVFSPERHSSEERVPRLHKSPLVRSTSANSGSSKRRSFADSPPRMDSDEDESDSSSSSTTIVNKEDRFKRSGSKSATPSSSPLKPPSSVAETVIRASPGRSVTHRDHDGSENEDESENSVKTKPKESTGQSDRFESGEKSPTFIETDDESDDEDDQMSITSYDHSESSSSESDSDGEAGESDMTL
ncbi:multifunctional expression regulator [Proboscivirus elephantidbeta5]|uniref:mRNA export factor ICP27 homolog n=1 Tax=Elephant endotheliotropic herpesvirus 5 TaxID=768738 RepID=A0A075CYF6_9BETA|nr:multifunctional expression regulator [Elephant endotheliotropic herpesvirus 5]AHC02835.1 multifunctional expression regulator [Elephant endotheliotropic herpesvirus 5]